MCEIEINELNKALNKKIDEINNLYNEMQNLKLNDDKKESVEVDNDELLTIQFESIEQKVCTSLTCQKSDIFVRIEEKLYNEYPIFKDLNTYFTINGRFVKRFKNVEENDIKNNDKILLNIYEKTE